MKSVPVSKRGAVSRQAASLVKILNLLPVGMRQGAEIEPVPIIDATV